MPSSWKKARKKLLKEGKLTKYLTYASGEIIIIAVGILLALYLNNRNQYRSDRQKEDRYYRAIRDQLREDLLTLKGEIGYNRAYQGQFARAAGLITANARGETDTLAAIALNMLRYSDFRRKSSIYQTLVNSGEVILLKNARVTSNLETLEEVYLYINRLEENHATLILSVIIPDLKATLQFEPIRVVDDEALFSPAFKNDLDILSGLMQEKSDAYGQAAEVIRTILQLIGEELGQGSPGPAGEDPTNTQGP